MKITVKSVFALAALTLLCGCATSRSVVTLNDATAIPTTAATPAAASTTPAMAVKIVEVEDKRVFLLKPPTPDLPSLQDGAITNKAITTRTIARKRNVYGQGLGDVLLPESDTVVNHMQTAVANGFRQAGYTVLSPTDPGYDQAVPVKAQILQYWSWFQPGFWELKLHCRSEIQFDTALPALAATPKITTEVENGMQMALDSDWQAIALKGLTSVTTKLAETLKAQKPFSQTSSID